MKYLAFLFVTACTTPNADVIDRVCKVDMQGVITCLDVPVQTVEQSGVVFDD